jgi:carboxylesterase
VQSPAACLLLHGFMGTTFDVAPLVHPLESLGLTVDAPLLPGHGASLEDFRRTLFPDWLEAAERHFDTLAAAHERVFVGGFSLGGVLALLLSARRPVAGVFVLATPLWLYRIFPWRVRDWRLLALPVLKHITPVVPMRPRSPEAQELAPSQGYAEGLPLAQLHSLGRGFTLARRALPDISSPILIVQDARDRTVGPDAGAYIARRVSSPDVTLHLTHARENVTGKHMITTHREIRDEVQDLCIKFVQRVAGKGDCGYSIGTASGVPTPCGCPASRLILK